MKAISSIKVLILSSLLSFSVFGKMSAQSSYIENHKILAKELSAQYGIPAAIILSIAYVESGGGTSKNSKNLNNHFGIVGENTVNNSRYRSFASVRDSYEAFCRLISRKKYYSSLKGQDNHQAWITAIAKAGYSTQPEEWKKRISLMISKIKL